MRRSTVHLIWPLVVVTMTMLLTAALVGAITYGRPDGTRHPNVGALSGTFNELT